MKFVDEYRDAGHVRRLQAEIARVTTRPWTLMEICGGQTHAIVRYGIDDLLPAAITLVHGPGCPVCVTPIETIDAAIQLAGRPGVTLCSFGDMLRVPGSGEDLLAARARGGDVRTVYSPLDALRIAQTEPGRDVVFFGVGFETTAPTTAMAVYQARELGVANFSLLVSHMLVPPAIEAILAAPDNRVQGFLAAGHVCTVTGYAGYEPVCARYQVPIVVTGFEPVDIMRGILMCVRQLESGQVRVENAYERVVSRDGNARARDLIATVFRTEPRRWRGMGEIAASGLGLREEFADFDARRRFPMENVSVVESSQCIAGLVLRGARRPTECPAFAAACTPDTPLGAPMVSTEGACAAYYRYRLEGGGQ